MVSFSALVFLSSSLHVRKKSFRLQQFSTHVSSFRTVNYLERLLTGTFLIQFVAGVKTVKVVVVYFAADAVLLSFGGFASAISAFLTVDAVSANVESVWMMMILV
ncbi:hypothetical protein ACSBR2_027064 [Camellia fascicularis]